MRWDLFGKKENIFYIIEPKKFRVLKFTKGEDKSLLCPEILWKIKIQNYNNQYIPVDIYIYFRCGNFEWNDNIFTYSKFTLPNVHDNYSICFGDMKINAKSIIDCIEQILKSFWNSYFNNDLYTDLCKDIFSIADPKRQLSKILSLEKKGEIYQSFDFILEEKEIT